MATAKSSILGVSLAATLAAAATFIGPYEGLRQDTYRDVVGVPTVCYGQTGAAAYPGAHYTVEECRKMLADSLARDYWPAIERCVKVGINPNQAIALLSFAYNLGGSALCRSDLVRKLNAGDRLGASKEFSKYVKAGGKVFPGLVCRRNAEETLFMKD